MRFCPLASGSSGNCIYVGSETTHLLIDCGITGKRTIQGLNELDLNLDNLNGIFITHEHSDHIKGLGVLLRKAEIPVYATAKTIRAIFNSGDLGKVDKDLFCEIKADNKITIGDLKINPMRISHDAVDPVAYRVSYGSQKVAVCTDLGVYDDYTVESLRGLDAILLEANHDVRMLQLGPYPYPLKMRILGDRGHLSNELSGQLLSKILHSGMQHVYLGHLSKENNMPELAYEAVRMELKLKAGLSIDGLSMSVAKRDEPSGLVEI